MALVASLLALQCKESGSFNPVGPPLRVLIISQLTAEPNRVSAGGGESLITGMLVDQDDQPFTDLTVSFSASKGTIVSADTTDIQGRFSVRYQAGDVAGIDSILVRAQDESAVVVVTIVGASADLTLGLSSTSILANGVDTVLVIAYLIGRDGPLNRIPIQFETTLGGFTGQRITYTQTNLDGRAEVVLTAASSNRTVVSTITAKVDNPEGIPRPDGKNGARLSVKGDAQPAGIDAEASIAITFRGVSIAAEATPTMIPGDGQATSEVRAFVKEENLQAVPNARVTFSAKLGSIPVEGITDASGVARVNLISARLPGVTDRITARYGPVLLDTIDVQYAPAVGRIVVTSETPSLRADGVSSVLITAQVFGGTGEAAPGVGVSFSSDLGSLFPDQALTDDLGKATTRLIAPASTADQFITVSGAVIENVTAADEGNSVGLASPAYQSLTIAKPSTPEDSPASSRIRGGRSLKTQAASDPLNLALGASTGGLKRDRADELSDDVSLLARGVQIRLSIDADSLVARVGVTGTVTAQVFETTSGNPAVGDTVRFGANLGSIAGSAVLNADGLAQVAFNAGDQTGRATINARFGAGLRDSVSVSLLPTIGAIQLDPDKAAILAGGIDTVRLRATALDPLGDPSPNVLLSLEIENHPEYTARARTNEAGQALFIIRSWTAEEDTAFRAIVRSGEISETVRVGVKAIRRLISSNPDSLSAGSGNPATITFQAFESTTRRPVVGDTIWFSGFGGVIQPFAVLNAEGVAATSFRAGNDPGEAWVTGQLGDLAPDTTRMTLVAPVASIELLAGRRSLLQNGIDTTLIAARVTNLLGDAAEGVWVQFATIGGSIAPPAIQTDQDGFARATFVSSAGRNDASARVFVTAIQRAQIIGEPVSPAFNSSAPISTRTDLQTLRPVRSLGAEEKGKTTTEIVAPDANPASAIRFKPIFIPLEADDASDSVAIEMRGVNLALRVSPNAIRADGRSKTGVGVQLTETTTGTAIANGDLRLGATRGAIAAAGRTLADGAYRDSLTSGYETGVSVVRVFYGDGVVATDSVEFTPDPARQNLLFQVSPAEATAGSDTAFTLRARVVDNDGAPSADIPVIFTLEGALWKLVVPDESHEVARWENTFSVDSREGVTGIRLQVQLRGIESAGTSIYLNRTRLDRAALPQSDLWGDYTLALPADNLLDGVNRIEILGAQDGAITDRFSIAGVRLGLMSSLVIGVAATEEDGWAEVAYPVDPVAGQVTFRAALVDAPNRYLQRTTRLTSGAPSYLHLSTSADTLLASGSEQTEFLALITDAGGNPVASGHQVRFSTANGTVEPAEAQTLGDGAAGGIYTSSASDRDLTAELTAQTGQVQGSWSLLLRGARLRLTIPESRILADGTTQLELRARLSTADGAAVSGRRIEFRTTRGSITPTVQTGADGVAAATLTAADVADTARITATFGPTISDSGEVIFAPLIEIIELSADPSSLRADGIDSARVTISVTDGLGSGARGVRIDFDADRGRLSTRRVITGDDGAASVFLYGIASVQDTSIRVVAATSGGAYRDTLNIRLRGVTSTLTSSEDSLSANGTSTAQLTARVIETTSGNPVESGRVFFSANRGSVTAFSRLGEGGTAVATYTAPLDSGQATIRMRYGDSLEDSTQIVLVDRVSTLDLSVAPSVILANGTATARVTATVTDLWGEGAPQELVTFTFGGPGWVSPASGATDGSGRFSAIVHDSASNSDGRLMLTASVRGGRLRQTVPLELRGVTLALTAAEALIAGDGRSTTTLTARVRETSTGHPVVGDTVRFSASAGTIAPFGVTDENGEARVTIRSEARLTIATITAVYGARLTESVQVAFTGRYSYLAFTLDRNSLLADGADSTRAAVILLDTLRRPVAGVTVNFATIGGAGTFTVDTAVTDEDGAAISYLRSSASVNDISGQVRAFLGSLTDTTSIAFRGVTLTVSSSPDSIPANGVSLSRITAQARETTRGNPVGGREVRFGSDAGVITGSAILEDDGRASVNLRAAGQAGTATVTCELGRTIVSQHRVTFIPIVGSLTLETGRGTLYGDGLDTTVVIARLIDAARNPAPNIPVQFESLGGGSVSPVEVTTDDQGVARALYTSFTTSADTTFSLRAVARGGASATSIMRLTGLSLLISAAPAELPANGRATSNIAAMLSETVRHTPLIARTIRFSADRGRISGEAATDSNGVARAEFTSPSVAGTATLEAAVGENLIASGQVVCYASNPNNVVLVISPNELSVAGVGRDETATLSAIVRDGHGNLVGDGNSISLKITPERGVRFSNDLDSIVVQTTDGVAQANVRAGATPGRVTFKAYTGATLLANGGELTITSGPPARVRVRADLGTIYNPAGGVTAFPVSATVSDQFGNPVEDGATVQFALNPDTLGTITSVGHTIGGVVITPIDPIEYPTGVWLTYTDDFAGEQVYIRATAGGQVVDSVLVTLPGDVQGGAAARIEVSLDAASLVADGGAEAILTLHLTDADGQMVADMTRIELSATLGSIQNPRFTAQGAAEAVYRAGRLAGVDTIRIRSGEVSDSVYIRLIPGAPDQMDFAVERNQMRANGIDATTISTTITDRFGNIVRPGTQVSFSTTLGNITPTAETDSAGRAVGRLTAGVETGIALVRAVSGAAEEQDAVSFVSGDPAGIVLINSDRTTIGVRGSGVAETATLLFEVRDDGGVPVDSLHPASVVFSLEGPDAIVNGDDTRAVLSADTVITDGAGRVSVTLRSGYYAGAVQITAAIGQAIRGRAISVAIVGGPPDANHFTLLPTRCTTTGIFGTPADTTLLNVTMGDRYSNPVTPGTIVRFSATGGVVQGAAQADSLGRCFAILRTTQPWPVGGIDTITAQTVDWNNREITTQAYLSVTGPTIASFDTTNGWRIPFGGYRDFTLTVADTFGHPLTSGTEVLISASAIGQRGEDLEGAVLTGDAVGESVILAECDGRTEFNVRLFNYVSGLDGSVLSLNAVITSANGNREIEIAGIGLPQVVSTELSRVVLSPTEIVADGVEVSAVTITVYDTLGIAIQNVPPDVVAITVVGGDALVTPPAAAGDDLGRLTGSIIARAIGQGTVQVRIQGDLIDDQPTLLFVAGPPTSMTIRVINRRMTVGGDTTTVEAYISDPNGNPTADGTNVFFEVDDGTMSPGLTTTVDGTATSILSSGIGSGVVNVTVTAVRRGFAVVNTSPDITYLAGPPDQITVSTETYSIVVGGQATMTITATDQYGNTVQGGTPFDLEVQPPANGNITPISANADTTGTATATFTAGTTAGASARVVATSGAITGQSSQFTFQPGTPGRLTLQANPTSLPVGDETDLTVNVQDSYGNAVSDTTRVTFSLNPQGGTLTPSVIRTVNGTATSLLSGVTEAGDVEVTATAGEMVGSVRVTFEVGDLSTITVMADPAAVTFGNSSAITATALDEYGNPVSGANLNFVFASNPGGNCALQNAQRRTAADGTAATIFTAGQTAGSAIITVYFDANSNGQLDEDSDPNGSTFVDISAGN